MGEREERRGERRRERRERRENVVDLPANFEQTASKCWLKMKTRMVNSIEKKGVQTS